MERINAERGTTFIFSSHDPSVMKRAGRVVRLHDGRLEVS
jgi:putative ABC transport system ATP-binding protein